MSWNPFHGCLAFVSISIWAKTIAIPAPAILTEALQDVQV